MKTISLGTGVRFCIATLLLLNTGRATAADISWKSPVSGDFTTPANWDPAGPPGAADSAIFNLGSAGYTVTIPIALQATVDRVQVSNDTLTIKNGSLAATNPTLPSIGLGLSAGDVGNLTLSISHLNGVNDAIGYAAQSQGSATLNTFSSWFSANVSVGYAGVGSVALNSGSSVGASQSVRIGAQPGSQGTMTLDGNSYLTVSPPQNNSNALIVGGAGNGTLTVHSGTVTVADQMVVAQSSNSQGAVTLDGSQAILTTPTAGNLNMSGLTVGYGGNGTFAIKNGATATIAGLLAIGRNGGSTSSLSITGANSLLTLPGFGNATMTSVTIGAAGDGTLSVAAAGNAVLGGDITLGQYAGSKGAVTVDGTGSVFDARPVSTPGGFIESFTVGDAGHASVSITAGGVAKLSGPIVIGNAASGAGTVTVDGAGSQLIPGVLNDAGLTVGGSGVGALSVTAGGLVQITHPFQIGENSGAEGTVSVDGASSKLTFPDGTVGGGGAGILSITRGATSTATKAILVGRDAGSSGGVTVDGGGSKFSFNGATIGGAGSATFDVAHGGQVTSTGPLVVGRDGGISGAITVDGGSSQFSFKGATIGGAGSATFAVAHGGQATSTDALTIGRDAGSSAGVTVDGGGSQLSFTGAMIGDSGAGTFALTAGATATSSSTIALGHVAGSSGILDIDGGGSKLTNTGTSSDGVFTIGASGHGQVTIGHAGVLTSALGSMIIAANAGSTGSVSVDGAGSNLTLQGNVPGQLPSIIVGQAGVGSLSVTGGATVASGPIYVGPLHQSTGQGSLSLDGVGSSLTITGGGGNPSQINGPVSITGGAVLSSTGASVGSMPNHNASVTVDGANSQWKASSTISFGSTTPTSLTIRNGGAVTTPALFGGPNSTIDIDGGTLTATTLTTQSKLIDNGRILGAVTVSGGVISGAGSVSGRVTVNSGVVSPGNSPGTLTVGGVVFTDATFKLEMNSASGLAGGPVGWDLLASTLGAGFNNHLTIALTSLTLANVAGDVSDFDPTHEYHWTFLTAPRGMSGFNPANISVDRSGFSNPIEGQFSVSRVGNNLVLNYSVPEPGTLALAALGGLAILALRRRANKRARR